MENAGIDRTVPLSVYAEELRVWLQLAKQYEQLAVVNYCFQIQTPGQQRQSQTYLLDQNSNVHLRTTPNSPNNNVTVRPSANDNDHNTNGNRRSQNQRASQTTPLPRAFPESAGTEVKIPSIGKRAAAEFIDCLILYVVKFLITHVLTTYAGLRAMQVFDFDYAFLNGELDLENFINISSEILLVEFVHKAFVSTYEAVCLSYVTDIIPPGGFTPGKRMMGLAVVGCDEVFSLGNDRFLVTGMRNPALSNTLCRSLIKNFSMSLLMPTWLTALLYDHRRSVYDLVTGTVVIELNH